MSLVGGKALGRREESKGWFGGAIWDCWGLEVVVVERVEMVDGVEASGGVWANVGAWFGAMFSRGACQI